MRTKVLATVVVSILAISAGALAQSRNAPRAANRASTGTGTSSRRAAASPPLGRAPLRQTPAPVASQRVVTRPAQVAAPRATPHRPMNTARTSARPQSAPDDAEVYDGPDITFQYERQGGPRGPETWTMQLRRGDQLSASEARTVRAHAPNLERYLRGASASVTSERPAFYRGPDITFHYTRQGGPRGPETWTMQLRRGDHLTASEVSTVRTHAPNLERFLSPAD